MRRKNPQIVPPRVGYYTHDFRDGRGSIRIKIVRGSWWCKMFDVPAITFWNRIYIRDVVIVRKRLVLEISKMRIQRKQGMIRYLWNEWKKK